MNNVTQQHSCANPNIAYAIKIVHSICCLAGSASYINDIRADLGNRGIIHAIRDHDTPALFDWLIQDLSFQGISDAVALGYIAEHGSVRWSDIADALSARPSCPKLGGYWRFYDCRYHKGAKTLLGAGPHRSLPPTPPPIEKRSPQSDGVQPVSVHARCRRWRFRRLDRSAISRG